MDKREELENLITKQKQAKQKRKAEERGEVSHTRSADIIQLPLWPADKRGIPNSVLRSALFGVIRKGRRQLLNDEEIASTKGISIQFSGERLNQADLDVWEQCLHLAKREGLDNKIHFSAYGFLKSIDRATGKSQHDWLEKSLKRLSKAHLFIQDGKRKYFGNMIHGGLKDDETRQYVIHLNPEIIKIYGNSHWTQVHWDQRQALKKQPLSQWLHGFYQTHKNPYNYKVETLKNLCGSEIARLGDFRKQLKKAILHVSEITCWEMWIDKDDLLNVSRNNIKRLPKT
jgi:hypothetical protein